MSVAVDVDALLGEIFLTPEGKSDPYPRYAAIREHTPAFRSAIGFVVVGRYEDCQWVLRDPRFGKGEGGPMWEGYGLTEEQIVRIGGSPCPRRKRERRFARIAQQGEVHERADEKRWSFAGPVGRSAADRRPDHRGGRGAGAEP